MSELNTVRRWRSRLIMVVIAVMFFGSFVAAASLFFGGWKPDSTRNFGTMLDPYISLQDMTLQHADGRDYAWQPEARRWRVLVVVPTACGEPCQRLLDALHRVWYSEGRHATRLDVLWMGELPPLAPQFSGLHAMRQAPMLSDRLPEASRPDALPVYLVDPNGYVVLHYPAGFNPSELRKDIGRLLK